MCLCKGKGSVVIEDRGVFQWNNCPDSDCAYDKKESEKRYEKWRKEVRELAIKYNVKEVQI